MNLPITHAEQISVHQSFFKRFHPSPTAPVRQRRVIESIILLVCRNKKAFEKIDDVLKGRETLAMYELGLEFLHLYDGIFNCGEEHIVRNAASLNKI